MKEFIAEIPPTKIGEKGLLTLIEFSKRRNYTQLEQYLKKFGKKKFLSMKKIFNCRRDFTDIKISLQYSSVTTSKPKKLRSSMEQFSWKTCCFLCSKKAERDENHPNRKQIFNVTLIPFQNQILEHCRDRNDEWANIVETRTSCSNDLVADKAVYHKECLTSFMLNWPSFKTKNKPTGCPVDENMLQSFEMLCIWLEVEADAELYTVTKLHKKMTDLANVETVYSTKWLKTKLKEKYKDSLYFAEINGRSDVVCSSNMIKCVVNDKWCKSRQSDKTKDVKRILIATAEIIMAEIQEIDYDNLVYPTHDDIVLLEKQDSFLTSSLRKFLEVPIRPKIKQNSIGQTIVYSTRPSSVIPPIPFGVGIKMDPI